MIPEDKEYGCNNPDCVVPGPLVYRVYRTDKEEFGAVA